MFGIEKLETRRFMSVTLSGGVLTINGTSGIDTLGVSQFNASTIRVRDNNAVTFVADTSVDVVVLNGLAGNDRLSVQLDGTQVDERGFMNGGLGNDFLTGGAGRDRLYGEAGNDFLSGGDNNDLLNGGTGTDDLRGGAGTADVADYSDAASGVTVSPDNLAFDGPAGESDNVRSDVEHFVGSAFADVYFGSGGNNEVSAGGGNDRIFGAGGDDVISGGTGDDHILAGRGNDTVFGDDGDDFIVGGLGADSLSGGNGNDTFYSAGDSTFLFTNDVVNGNAGFDLAESDSRDILISIANGVRD